MGHQHEKRDESQRTDREKVPVFLELYSPRFQRLTGAAPRKRALWNPLSVTFLEVARILDMRAVHETER
jgi:hypothetical protein